MKKTTVHLKDNVERGALEAAFKYTRRHRTSSKKILKNQKTGVAICGVI